MTLELPIDPLPEGVVLVGAIVIAEVIDVDGQPMLCTRSTDGLASWQGVGLAIAGADKLRAQVVDNWRPREDPDT